MVLRHQDMAAAYSCNSQLDHCFSQKNEGLHRPVRPTTTFPARLISCGQRRENPNRLLWLPRFSGECSGPNVEHMNSNAQPPVRVAITFLHLLAYGLLGFALLGTLVSIIGAGIGLIFVLGLGLVVLVGVVYALYGIAWFEVERVTGLYRLGSVPPLKLRPHAPGFMGWLKGLGRQAIDGRMWAAIANFAVTSLLGTAVVGLVQWFARSLGLLADPEDLWLAILGLVLAPVVIWGLILLHRAISMPIISAGARNQQLLAQVAETAQQREGAVRAADVERTRIERDLHDGVQPRLVSVAMTLGLAQDMIFEDPAEAKKLVTEAHTSTKAAITELRQLARGIYASVLDDRGLDAALSALAARSHIPVTLDVRLSRRHPRDAEAAVYFAIAESLTNAAKHSHASECRVIVRERTDEEATRLWARIEDNGSGGARIVPGGGLDGIEGRVSAAGGTMTLDSPQGGPTALEVSVPCAS